MMKNNNKGKGGCIINIIIVDSSEKRIKVRRTKERKTIAKTVMKGKVNKIGFQNQM